MLSHPEGTRYTVLTPIHLREDRSLQQQLEIDLKQGFNRIEVNGEMKRIDEYKPVAGDEVYLLVDRMAVADTKDAISRLTDSAETAMYEGDGTCMLQHNCSPSAQSSKQTVSLLKNPMTRCFHSTPRSVPAPPVRASAKLSV